jgi:hypothetical protein
MAMASVPSSEHAYPCRWRKVLAKPGVQPYARAVLNRRDFTSIGLLTRRKLPRLLLASGLLLAAIVWLGFMLHVFGGSLRAHPPQQPLIHLRLDRIGTCGGPWTIDIFADAVAITAPDGILLRSAATQTAIGQDQVRFTLIPPHPVLGATIELKGSNPVTVITTGGTVDTGPLP